MAKPIVELYNSFEEWRLITNVISNNVGDPELILPDQTFTVSDVTSALNDLYTKKFNRSGGDITGNISVATNKFNVTASTGNTSIAGTLGVAGNMSVNTNKFNVTATSGNTSIAGTLGVTGATTLTGLLTTNGNLYVGASKVTMLSSNGNTAIAGTLSVAGTTSLAITSTTTLTATGACLLSSTLGVTGNLSINTNKFNVTAASGNTAIAGTLSVVGTTTLSSSLVSTTGTITTNKPILSATQTWNSAGTLFKGISIDITNTASAAGSLLLDFKLAGADKFGIDVNGAVKQYLTGTYLARTVFSGSRGVREYQDLMDDGIQGLPGTPGIETDSFEWGFTWNAKWDSGTQTYIKDRTLAGDHALMYRINRKFGNQWWFSEGTSPGSPILWTKKVDFDLPANTYTFKNGANETIITPTELTTQIVNATDKLIVGQISYFDALEIITTSTTPAVIASMPIATYRSATFEVQAVNSTGGKYHRTNISFIHNGSTSDSLEFGSINIGGLCATYTTQLNAGNVEIIATPTSANSTIFKIHVRLMSA